MSRPCWVLGRVALVEAYTPATDDRLLHIVVDASLGLSGVIVDALGFAGADMLVVHFIAIVKRAVWGSYRWQQPCKHGHRLHGW